MGSIPGLGRSPGEGKGYPLQYSGLENSMNCISSWGCKDSDTTEQLSLSLHFLVLALAELIPIKIPLREVRKHHQLRLPFTNISTGRLALMRAPHPLPMAVQRREEWGAGKAPHRGLPKTWHDERVWPTHCLTARLCPLLDGTPCLLLGPSGSWHWEKDFRASG